MTHSKDAVSNAETGGTRSRQQAPPSPRWFSHPAVAHLLALLGYALATVVFTWPLALNLTFAIPGDSFDGWQNFWNLWWVKIVLVERVSNPLYTDLLYHPTGAGLYFQTLNPFNGVMTLPIQVAGNLYLAYNAVVFFSWVGAGYGTFLLGRWVIGRGWGNAGGNGQFSITNNQWSMVNGQWSIVNEGRGEGRGEGDRGWAFVGAFFAGLVFTLAPVHSAHLLGHMQVFSLEWLPFYLLYLLMALQRSMAGRRWVRSALLAGVFLAFNGLCDWYFVLYLFLFTALAVVWAWGASRFTAPKLPVWVGLWRSVRPALVAGALFAVLLSFWLAPMVAEALQFKFMVRPPADLYVFSASAADFVIPNRLHSLFMPGSFEWPGNQIAPVSERTIAVGYIALVLAVVALFTARRRAAFWWVTAIGFFLLALGPLIHFGNITLDSIPAAVLDGVDVRSWTPYGLLNQLVPFMRISRSVSRFAIMVQLSVSVLAGLGLATLLYWMRTPVTQGDAAGPPWYRSLAAQYVLVFLCVGGLLAEYWVAPFPVSPPDTPAFYEQLATDPDPRAVLNLPMNYDRPGYLLYQTVHGKPLTVAYISRDDPRTMTERSPVLQNFRHLGTDIIEADLAQVGLAMLADLEVGTVVLDRYKMPGGDERTVTEALTQAIFGTQAPVYADERITVYQVPQTVTPEPYLRLGPLNWGALERTETGAPYRQLLGPAAVELMHVPPGAALRVRYRTVDGSSGLRVMALDNDTPIMELAPAPDGNEVVVEIANTTGGVRLAPDTPGAVMIELIGLED